MSFKRLEPEDFLISTDAIVAPAFAGGSSTSTATSAGNTGVSSEYFSAYEGTDGRIEYSVAGMEKDAVGTDENLHIIYTQVANIINGNSSTDIPITSGSVIAIERSRFKQSIFPNTFKLGTEAPLTGSSDITFTDAGRQYAGASGGYYIYPDAGIILHSEGNSTKAITADSEEVITSNYIFIRARNAEFNYTTNPSFIDTTTGGVLYTDFITAPQTFITTVGLYNDNGDLLAVAKLSKPLKKDFTKEALIRVKLDF